MDNEQQNTNACANTSNVFVQTLFKGDSTVSPPTSHNFVPFLIKSHRFASQKKYSSIPPIGAYNIPSCFDRKKSPLEDRISHFMLQAQRKKQHMGIFKSSLTRFSKINSSVPGPATYNLFKIKTEQTQQKSRVQRKDRSGELGKSCPSIPHQQLKYGYVVVDGQMKGIQKNLEQLQKDRENRKIYTSTLQGEKTFQQQQNYHNYHNADYRKRLYESTQKIVSKDHSFTQSSNSERANKKPRYQHLYHSKPVPISPNSTIGPGQYEINGSFNSSDKQEKFQFFSSTEVRFKDRVNCYDKGYSLIDMIKENSRKSITEANKQRKPDFKKKSRVLIKQEHTVRNPKLEPGPGQYNPIDNIIKKTRGTAVFPCQERFKQIPSQIPIVDEDQYLGLGQVTQKKHVCPGTLKKDRFKPIHKTYYPVKCEQIGGISVQKHETSMGKQNKQSPSGMPSQLKREGKKTTKDSQYISCWSRGLGKQKTLPKCYMKALKQQLAIINHSFGAGLSQSSIVQSCKRSHKNKSQFLQQNQSQ